MLDLASSSMLFLVLTAGLEENDYLMMFVDVSYLVCCRVYISIGSH